MKNHKLFLLTALICLIGFDNNAQNLLVANNNPGAPAGEYSTIAAAIAAASAGDIIYMVPSSVSYGTVSITKSLTIFGAGMIPDKDLSIKTIVNDVRCDASNVRISGLVSTYKWYYGYSISSTSISNINIENCRFASFQNYNSNVQIGNLLIRNNIISDQAAECIVLSSSSSVIVTNNIIHISTSSSGYGLKADGVTFSNNIFRSHGTNGLDGVTINIVSNSLFEYNIFYGAKATVTNGTGNTFNYNLSYGCNDNTIPATGAGNVANGDPKFVNLGLGLSWLDTYDPALSGGSAADDIDGSGGISGVTGGATPWDPDGSLLPTIQSITIPSVVPAGVDLEVNIKGKGN